MGGTVSGRLRLEEACPRLRRDGLHPAAAAEGRARAGTRACWSRHKGRREPPPRWTTPVRLTARVGLRQDAVGKEIP